MALRILLSLVLISLLPILCAESTPPDPSLLSEDAVVSLEQNADAVSSTKDIQLELHHLKSKISSLEIRIDEKKVELERKDDSIKQLEKIIEEKSDTLASLQSSLQDKGSLDVKEHSGEFNARVGELEKQIFNLIKDIQAQDKKKENLEARANTAQKKIEGLNMKLDNLQRINEEQKLKIRKTQRALQVVEEEMLKAKLEASSITKQFKEVHQVRLPPWLSAHLVHFQSVFIAHWNEHGRPALRFTIDKGLKQKSEVEKWVQPHFEMLKTKWFPSAKEYLKAFVDDFHPLMQSLSIQATDYYNLAHNTVEPHVIKIRAIMSPYFQKAKKSVAPFLGQVSRIMKPHLDKAHPFVKPYTKKMVRYQKKITKHIRKYHSQVRAKLHVILNSYELTKPLATERMIWIMATILMSMPVIAVSGMFQPKERKKRRRTTKTGHVRQRAKRSHPDK